MAQKKVLLTGATGFLGSHLLEALIKANYKVIILKRSSSDLWRIKHLLNDIIAYDIDMMPIESAFTDNEINTVIHTACAYGRNREKDSEVVETNLMFSLRLLEVATFFNIATFFNTDTLSPKHLNSYTLSKKHFVEWLNQYRNRIQIINLKIEHMYGPKDDEKKFVPWLFAQFQQEVETIPLTEGKQFRDFIYIDDVVCAYLLLLSITDKLELFNQFDVGTGKLISVRNFVEKLYHIYKKRENNNLPTLNFGAVPTRKGELVRVEVNITALNNLGWNANFSIETGLLKLIKESQNP